ncbi:MAG: hypothetical protein IJW20_04515 [Clostridia bacterium]|nr:hypothetical protein [Clostridia bacterium]
MYNFVIFISDFNLIKKFGSFIFNNFKEMNLVGIVSTHKELEALHKKNKINLVVLSETKYNSRPIHNLLNNIESVIVITDSNCDNKKSSKHLLYLSTQESERSILEKLCKFDKVIYNHFLEHKVTRILESFKFDFKFLGTTYLLEAIIYAYLTKESYQFENLEKNIFPFVSQKYNTEVPNIKWAITRSVNNVKPRLTPEIFKNNNMHFPDKFTTKYFITEIINLL